MKISNLQKIILVIFALVVLVFSVILLDYFFMPIISKDSVSLDVVFERGTTIKDFVAELKVRGIVNHPEFLIMAARLKGISRELKAGEYKIESGITTAELLDKLVRGDVIMHGFTIVEGWTFKYMVKALEADPYLVHTLVNLSDAEIMQRIGEEGKEPEGVFAPDTYMFSGKVTDVEVLRSAYNLMQKRLMAEWNNRDEQVIYDCPYKTLIVASMIEKETADKMEKPLISGVIMRRLDKGMPLQIDATVIYGMGDKYTGKLYDKNLTYRSSYNTYLHAGLPPTPIAMPGLDSIHAALHPELNKYMYYVAKGDGTHYFSATLQEHRAAIRKYRRYKKHQQNSISSK